MLWTSSDTVSDEHGIGSVWTVCEVLCRGSDVMVYELLATKLDVISSEVLAEGCGIPD